MADIWEPYPDRAAAGAALAERLSEYRDREDALVLGLPRGGVPVAIAVAESLHVEVDVLIVRKLGLPSQPELAMGAIASVAGEVAMVRNERVLAAAHISEHEIDTVYLRELVELRRRESHYREGRPAADVEDRTIILVDDGLATGSTALAAISALRPHAPRSVTVAAPLGSLDACETLHNHADQVLCAHTPVPFYAVGQGYRDFRAPTDDEVRAALRGAAAQSHANQPQERPLS